VFVVIYIYINEMSGACSRHGRYEKFTHNFGLKTRREEAVQKM
jgi:hypothetical protein